MKKFTFKVEKRVQSTFEYEVTAETYEDACITWEYEMLDMKNEHVAGETIEYFEVGVFAVKETEVE
jgi:hypothetical protein